MSTIGIDDSYLDSTNEENVDWSLFFDPGQWYITPELVLDKYQSFLFALGGSALATIIYVLFYLYGKQWWDGQKRTRFNFSDFTTNLLWCGMHYPLALSAWIIYLENDEEWCRALTIYSITIGVNAVYPISLFAIRDYSLALMNLLILIGVSMFTTSQFNPILPFCSSINTPYLLFLFVYLVQFCIIWYFNEGKKMMKEMMKEGLVKSTFSLTTGSSRSKVTNKERKKKTEKFPGSRKKMEELKKKTQKMKENSDKKSD